MPVLQLLKPNCFHACHVRHRASLSGLISSIFILLISLGCNPSKDKPDSSAEIVAAVDTIASVDINPDRLNGRWLRPDGGYILEIRNAAADGKLDVGYFNPNAINVGRAEWVEKDGKLYVMVELQDVNYPGSTYGLEYIVAKDHLTGTYFQAVEKSTFDVEFVREK